MNKREAIIRMNKRYGVSKLHFHDTPQETEPARHRA